MAGATRVESPRTPAPAHGPSTALSDSRGLFGPGPAHHIDVAIELYDQCLWDYASAARKELKDWRQTIARSTNEKLRALVEKEMAACGRGEDEGGGPAPRDAI